MPHQPLSEFFGEQARMPPTLAKALSPRDHEPLSKVIGPQGARSAPPSTVREQHGASEDSRERGR